MSVNRRKVQRDKVGSETEEEVLRPKVAKESTINDLEFELSFVATQTYKP